MAVSVYRKTIVLVPQGRTLSSEQRAILAELRLIDNIEYVDSLETATRFLSTQLRKNKCGAKTKCIYCGKRGKLPCSEITVSEPGPGLVQVTVHLEAHDKNTINVAGSTIDLLSFFHNEQVLWHASLSAGFQRINLRSIPKPPDHDSLRLNWTQLKILELSLVRGPGSFNTLSTIEIYPLARIVLGSTSLEMLYMKHVTFEGALTPLFHAIEKSESIRNLHLEGCTLSNQPSALNVSNEKDVPETHGRRDNQSLEELQIVKCVPCKDTILWFASLLACCRNLQVASFSETPLLENAQGFLEGLGCCSRLHDLCLTDCSFPNMEPLVQSLPSKTLQNLKLSGGRWTKSSLETLGSLLAADQCQLRQLNLSNCNVELSSSFLQALGRNKSLTEINLTKSRVTIGAEDIIRDTRGRNETIAVVHLEGNEYIVENEVVNSEPLSHEAHVVASQLETVHQMMSGMQLFLPAMLGLAKLEVVGEFISKEAFSMLATYLWSDSCTLQSLKLRNLRDDAHDFDLLFKVLHENTTLKSLDVHGNHFSHGTIVNLAAALRVNTTLQGLALSGCKLTNEAVSALASHFEFFRGLQSLDLSSNTFERQAASDIAEGMKKNGSITSIQVYNACWSTGGPIVFVCEGYEKENRKMQFFAEWNRFSNWPTRIRDLRGNVDEIYNLLRDEIVPSRFEQPPRY